MLAGIEEPCLTGRKDERVTGGSVHDIGIGPTPRSSKPGARGNDGSPAAIDDAATVGTAAAGAATDAHGT